MELAGLPRVSCVKTVDFAHFDALTFSEVLIGTARPNEYQCFADESGFNSMPINPFAD